MKPVNITFYIIFIIVIAVNAYALINETPEGSLDAPILEGGSKIQIPYVDKKNIVNIFLSAVETNGLEALDVKIEKEYLQPYQIVIVYEIGYVAPVIKVISKIDPPLPVPHIDHLYITKIAATMNLDGEIIDIIVHSDY